MGARVSRPGRGRVKAETRWPLRQSRTWPKRLARGQNDEPTGKSSIRRSAPKRQASAKPSFEDKDEDDRNRVQSIDLWCIPRLSWGVFSLMCGFERFQHSPKSLDLSPEVS